MASGKVYTLSLDQGGHASRALVFDQNGRLAASAECVIRTRTSGRLRVEHAPQALLHSLQKAADIAVGRLPRRAEISTTALATQRSSIACWDRRNGRALSPVISWQDRRAIRRVAALAPHTQEVRALTGLVLSPHYGASKLAWCLEHLAPVRLAQRQGQLAAGPLASFIVANLLLEQPCIADPVNGGRTQLLDVQRGAWSPRLCEIFGVAKEILPDCVPNAFRFGHLKAGGRSIPLTVVTGDQPAALFALGEPRADTAYVNIGTGAFVQCLRAADVPGLLHSLIWRSADETLYALEGTVNGAGAALQWLATRSHVPMAKALRLLPEWLASVQEPPLFLNGVGGLGAPYWRPAFRSRFIGKGGTPEKMVAVLESVVFLLLENLERMQQGDARIRRITVSGGSRSSTDSASGSRT
ncbi:MAG TPA: FGGY family carbohydrate kinase [Gammaproteobacteria bacterium]|jgi:glycerol kinase|nr:FGGY family carbohydrate kinase [Gammaproteobacteria bacterium]